MVFTINEDVHLNSNGNWLSYVFEYSEDAKRERVINLPVFVISVFLYDIFTSYVPG